MLNVQIFGVKNSPAVRTAERFFKERRIPIHFVDLKQKPMAPGEIRRFIDRFGLTSLLDAEGKPYVDAGLGYLKLSDSGLLSRIEREPKLPDIEKDLGTPLEWVGVAHYNTEHPHVHIALRVVGAEGRLVRLSRDYVGEGIREIAEDLCTRQLGYRTEFDAAVAQRREVHQHRYTSLDRIIQRDADKAAEATPHSLRSRRTPAALDSVEMCR